MELVRLLASIFVIMVRLPVYLTEEKNDWKNYATGQKEKNQRMYPYTGDARNYSNLARMAEQIVGCFGKIDIWINCAGQNKAIGCLWDLDPEICGWKQK